MLELMCSQFSSNTFKKKTIYYYKNIYDFFKAIYSTFKSNKIKKINLHWKPFIIVYTSCLFFLFFKVLNFCILPLLKRNVFFLIYTHIYK